MSACILVRIGALIFAFLVFTASCMVSTASAQTTTSQFPGKIYTTVQIRGYPGDSACLQLYTPPSPYFLVITDLMLDSYGSSVPIPYQYICTGAPVCALARSAYITAPAGGTLTTNFGSGIKVNAGETLSVCNYGGIGKISSWTMNGTLYSPTPDSAPNVATAADAAQRALKQPTPPPVNRR